MDEQSRKLTTFIVSERQYAFLRASLCNSLSIFQIFISTVFRNLIQSKIVLAYMDNLIIPSIDCDT